MTTDNKKSKSNKLPTEAYAWALEHLRLQGDTDLFPTPPEIAYVYENKDELLPKLQKLDVSSYTWGEGRRFIIPKGELSFRTVTQLEPLDGVVLAALMKKYGRVLERSRVPISEEKVFSYRFQPTDDGRFFGDSTGWLEFWGRSKRLAEHASCKYVAIADISDFYNQIYHHTLENELQGARLPNHVYTSIKKLVQTLTSSISRGLPVGPHPIHLLAECSLSPVDRSLATIKRSYTRYVDDFHFFCKSKQDAEIAIYDLARILDKQQKLTLQGQKTAIVPKDDFVARAKAHLVNQTFNDTEKEILEAIAECTDGDPYAIVTLATLSEEALENISEEHISELFDEYLRQSNPAFFRIGWLLRRLAQVGTPGALRYVISNIGKLTPILGDVARYIIRSCPNYQGGKKKLGATIIKSLRHHLISKSPYLQMVLINMFFHSVELNHAAEMVRMFDKVPSEVQREIVFVAGKHGLKDWIREHKIALDGSDPWLRRAWVYAYSALPREEADVWIKNNRAKLNALEMVIAREAFRDIREVKIGDISFAKG